MFNLETRCTDPPTLILASQTRFTTNVNSTVTYDCSDSGKFTNGLAAVTIICTYRGEWDVLYDDIVMFIDQEHSEMGYVLTDCIGKINVFLRSIDIDI